MSSIDLTRSYHSGGGNESASGRTRGHLSASTMSGAKRMARLLVSLPGNALLLLIRIYQRTLSPALPVFFGSACGCRFSPTCSHYAAEAIRTHGAIKGVLLAAVRLVKCTPLHPGGFDPVPAKSAKRPSCSLVPKSIGPAVS